MSGCKKYANLYFEAYAWPRLLADQSRFYTSDMFRHIIYNYVVYNIHIYKCTQQSNGGVKLIVNAAKLGI